MYLIGAYKNLLRVGVPRAPRSEAAQKSSRMPSYSAGSYISPCRWEMTEAD
jgi:hypothetical protein